MAYATVDDFILYGKHTSMSSNDALVTALLAQSQDAIDDYCKRTFEADSDTVGSSSAYMTRYFDAIADVEGSELFLDRDLCEINTVISDTNTVTSDNYVTNPRNDAPFYSIKILGSSSDSWTYTTDPENAISVSGIWAYSKTAPPIVKYATLRLTNWFYKQRVADLDADRPIQTQYGFAVMPSAWPADVKQALDPLRRNSVYGI